EGCSVEKDPSYQGLFKVSTVFVDNFVEKGILMSRNQSHPACNPQKTGKNSQILFFKISHLENASQRGQNGTCFPSAVHK
ncbi:hypothetical protein, partial [Paludibacterium sp.]|uniref:hypothetical protein n=1 Tax=Paludibacterium sp. TaxID=1917523 RepID=UPI0025D4F32E